jgi:lysine 2,3-aminomutase
MFIVKSMANVKNITKLEDLKSFVSKDLNIPSDVIKKFSFMATSYYLSLIDWDDPNDPLRRIVVPDSEELYPWGEIDPSCESLFTVAPDLEHKYKETALLLVTNSCGSYCRFCFRKRIFFKGTNEISSDYTEAFNYLKNNKEIDTVVISGGDPLVLSTDKLSEILFELKDIEHIKTIRIGTKMFAFNPFRIIEDKKLLNLFREFNKESQKLFIMSHFSHPKELTSDAIKAINLVHDTKSTIMNQTPILKGINDSVEILSKLLNDLVTLGIVPYYVFICRPTIGNYTYSVPVERAADIFFIAKQKLTGLARKVILSMSHKDGKVEVLYKTKNNIYFRFHRSPDPEKDYRILKAPLNPEARWFDDYNITYLE